MRYFLFIMICLGFKVAQSQQQNCGDDVNGASLTWNTDGSLIVDGDVRLRSSVVPSAGSISESEMILINADMLQSKQSTKFGIYSKESPNTPDNRYVQFTMHGRKHKDETTCPVGFDYSYDDHRNNYLIYGCDTDEHSQPEFRLEEHSWHAYRYCISEFRHWRHVDSDDYVRLLNRDGLDKCWTAGQWAEMIGLAVGAVVLAAVATYTGQFELYAEVSELAAEGIELTEVAGEGGAMILEEAEEAAPLLGAAEAGATQSAGQALTTAGGVYYASLAGAGALGMAALAEASTGKTITAGSTYSGDQIVSTIPLSSNMELPIPSKIADPQDEDAANWNEAIDDLDKIAGFPCTEDPTKRCWKPNYSPVGVQMRINNAHVKSVRFPGCLKGHLTPYQLFQEYRYDLDVNSKATIAIDNFNDVSNTYATVEDQGFTRIGKPLPRNMFFSDTNQDITLHFQNYYLPPAIYLLDKASNSELLGRPKNADAGIVDLGEHFDSEGETYNLYKMQLLSFEPFTFSTGPAGPFLGADNVESNDIRLYVNTVARNNNVFETNVGDKIRIEVDKTLVANASDIQIDGLPGVWVARFGWDVMYQRTESFRPGEYYPFLGFDSQVHSVFLRRFADYFKHGTNGYQLQIPDWEDQGTYWSWEYTVQARMDKEKTVYEPAVDWEVAKIADQPIAEDPDNNYQSTQRHDQRIGQMMYLLNRYDDNGENETFNGDGIKSTFQTFKGKDNYFMQCDPDEFMYLHRLGTHVEAGDTGLKLPKIKKDNNTQPEPWHPLLPQEMPGNPAPYKNNLALSYMVTAYQRNQSGDGSYPAYRGFEIEDKGVNIKNDGTPCLGRADCFYKIDASAGSDYQGYEHNAAPGKVTIYKKGASTLEELKTWSVQSNSPQTKDYGFYGSLIGTEWPAQYEKQVPYTFLGLDDLADEELQKFSMSLEYEGHFGYLERETRKLADLSVADRQTISANGAWTEKFDIQGWGTYNLSVLYKDCLSCDSVVVAGKELNEIQLRFLAVNLVTEDNTSVKLDGSRGDGYFWYMQDSRKGDDNATPEFGEKPDAYGREYTITKGSTLNFSILDADPHTFRPDGIEFYKSNRSKSKRIPNDSLSGPNGYVQWYIRNVSEGPTAFTESSQINIGSGKEASHTFGTNGTYTVVVLYRDVDDYKNGQTREVKHLINVVDYNGESSGSEEPVRGAISIYNLSDDQKQWLKEANLQDSDGSSISDADIDNSYKIAAVEHILSKYTYGEPNARPSKGTYDKENDFAAKFRWYIDRGVGNLSLYAPVDIPILSQNSPTSNPLLDFRESFPVDWIRHTPGTSIQDKNIDPSRVIEVTDGNNWILTENSGENDVSKIHLRWDQLFSSAPEAWNLRFAWIATTKFHGYQIRNNIKSVIKLDKLFDKTHGAFAGTGNSAYSKEAYESAVEFPVPVTGTDGLTDKVKSKQKFYYDLANGRKLLFIPEDNTSLVVKNEFQRSAEESVDNFINLIQIEIASPRFITEQEIEVGHKGLVVYPNASSGTFYLDFGMEQDSEVEFEVASLSGRIVYAQTLPLSKGIHNFQITLPGDVAKGVYVLRMRSPEISESRTIRVE